MISRTQELYFAYVFYDADLLWKKKLFPKVNRFLRYWLLDGSSSSQWIPIVAISDSGAMGMLRWHLGSRNGILPAYFVTRINFETRSFFLRSTIFEILPPRRSFFFPVDPSSKSLIRLMHAVSLSFANKNRETFCAFQDFVSSFEGVNLKVHI